MGEHLKKGFRSLKMRRQSGGMTFGGGCRGSNAGRAEEVGGGGLRREDGGRTAGLLNSLKVEKTRACINSIKKNKLLT